jgi:hypothetical protein
MAMCRSNTATATTAGKSTPLRGHRHNLCRQPHFPYWLEQLADGGRLVIPLGDTTTFPDVDVSRKKRRRAGGYADHERVVCPDDGEAMP